MELTQEPEIGAVEQADVVHAVAHHHQPVQTDVDIETGVFIRVQPCRPQDIGVRRAAGHDLDPAHVLAHAAALAAADQTAHVDLEAGLHEGEEARPHPHRDIPAEHLGEDALDHHLAGGEGEVLVHDEGLILEEGTLVAGIGGLVAVHPAGVHEAIGGLVGLHIPHGAAGEVGTQAELIPALALVVTLQPVGVHALAGGVVGGEGKYACT